MTETLFNLAAKTCFVSVGYNIDYLGSENRTETGAECLNWQDTTWASRDCESSFLLKHKDLFLNVIIVKRRICKRLSSFLDCFKIMI